jgi:hypothetical protein
MMVMTYTPGPWFAGDPIEDDSGMLIVSVGGLDLSDRPGRRHHYEDTICEVWDNPNNAGDVVDTARIIAAVPQLVTDAQFLIDRLYEFEASLEDGASFREFHGHVAPALVRFRAAIENAVSA